MKCQNCGKNEINFHYSSNVNGCVTETHLCSECAAESGFDFVRNFDTQSMFSGFFPMNMGGEFLTFPMFGFPPPRILKHHSFAGIPQTASDECGCGGSCGTLPEDKPAPQVDDEIRKRREVNILKEQMRLAAEKDEFEKAAELRDKIKQMEAE